MVGIERRRLGTTNVELSVVGVRASQPFNVIGKESQSARASLVRNAIGRGINTFGTSPIFGEAERILAAGLTGFRHRANVLTTIRNPDIAAAYREIDVSLHLFDGRVNLIMADWQIISDDILTSFARMRSVGEAAAFGVACQSITELRTAAGKTVVEGFDAIALPATLLMFSETSRLIDDITGRHCSVLAYVPDGLESAGGASLDDLKINLSRHGLETGADVLIKMALSDPRITSVMIPVRRTRDLDRIEDFNASPPFRTSEITALQTG